MIERKFVKEGLNRSKLNAYLRQRLKRAGYVGVQIQKTPLMTRLAIRVERPGLVIGRKGATIKELTETIQAKFRIDNVQIKVDEIPVPELDSAIMARRIASSLEKGMNFRRILHWTLEKIMKSGAIGAEIVVSGKLIGKGGKARTERVSAGYLKKAGDPAKMVNVAQTQAIKKAGIIGVTVSIVPPSVQFADKVDVSTAVIGGEKGGNTEAEGSQEPEQGRPAEQAPAAAD
ncbi:MAG: 30S ribosomal protein S3 [Candidatus Diapherotrites archaeon]|nr:30S ribosomal protein S3 [Candidatus Diapherotrites archaeon]